MKANNRKQFKNVLKRGSFLVCLALLSAGLSSCASMQPHSPSEEKKLLEEAQARWALRTLMMERGHPWGTRQ
jgi:hypothetical protein